MLLKTVQSHDLFKSMLTFGKNEGFSAPDSVCTEFQKSACEGLFTVNRVRFGAKTKLYDSASPSLNIMSYWYTWCSNAPSLENLLWSHLFIVSVAQSQQTVSAGSMSALQAVSCREIEIIMQRLIRGDINPLLNLCKLCSILSQHVNIYTRLKFSYLGSGVQFIPSPRIINIKQSSQSSF